MPMCFYSEAGSQYRSRKIVSQAFILPNSNCVLNGEMISWSSDMISTHETYVSSVCKVYQNMLLNIICPHNVLCTRWLWQITIVVKKSIFWVEAVIMLTCKLNSSCKCIVFLPLRLVLGHYVRILYIYTCALQLIVVNPYCFYLRGYKYMRWCEILLPC